MFSNNLQKQIQEKVHLISFTKLPKLRNEKREENTETLLYFLPSL